MTTETPSTRPVKYATLEWRNRQSEVFENFQEGAVCYQKDGDTPFSGRAVDHYDNGGMAIEGCFLEGFAHGEETWWFENGNKNSLVTYRRGERHGPHLVWYESGQLQVDVCYKNGKRDGRHAVYFEGGQVRSEAYFSNDKLDGAYTTRFENGSNRSERIFMAGKEIKRREWKKSGEQKKLNNWKVDGSPA
jgi:antitoxin component YwqK of YwqJK toxin-antitoxin module